MDPDAFRIHQAFRRFMPLCYYGTNNAEHIYEQQRISELESILREAPEVLNRTDDDECTLLHFAISHRSVEFIKLMVESREDLVTIPNRRGELPIHCACLWGNVEAVKYLHSICPESINIADNHGFYPVHHSLKKPHQDDHDDLI
jgi:ankyrin repeat protein